MPPPVRERRQLSAVIFLKLRHLQPLANARSTSLPQLTKTHSSELVVVTSIAHFKLGLCLANQIIGKVNWILT